MDRLPPPKFVIYGLYCLHCDRSEIRYVGQTSQGASTRLSAHLAMAKFRRDRDMSLSRSQRWMLKHGLENIAVTVLEVCIDSDDLERAEPIWIEQFSNLTNLKAGGATARGHRMPESAVAKMRGEGNPMWGKDRRQLMMYARSFQGPASPETRARMSASGTGRKHSPESIEKMRLGQSAAWTPERKERQSVARMGEKHPLYGSVRSVESRHQQSLSATPLSTQEIREIKRLRVEGGLMLHEIAALFPGKASKHTVGAICRGDKFAWLFDGSFVG